MTFKKVLIIGGAVIFAQILDGVTRALTAAFGATEVGAASAGGYAAGILLGLICANGLVTDDEPASQPKADQSLPQVRMETDDGRR